MNLRLTRGDAVPTPLQGRCPISTNLFSNVPENIVKRVSSCTPSVSFADSSLKEGAIFASLFEGGGTKCRWECLSVGVDLPQFVPNW